MKKRIQVILAVLVLTCAGKAFAQCDTIASVCARHLTTHYISDGQQYRSLLLNAEETAEFHATFYGGSTYRISACSGLSDGNLIFTIMDSERNLIFTNSEYKNAPYWDFKINSTIDAIIEAKLNASNQGSGCAVMLIGFKK